MGELFSKPKYQEKKTQHPPTLPKPNPPKELTEEEKQEKIENKYKDALVLYIIDKFKQYGLSNPDMKELKFELPIGYIQPTSYPEMIHVRMYIMLKIMEQNHHSAAIGLYFMIENMKDSKILFIKPISLNTVYICQDNKYRIEHMEYPIRSSLDEIKKILDNMKVNTLYECFEQHYYYDVHASTKTVFQNLKNIEFHNTECKKCGGYTKNKEYCYFCS